MHRPSMSIARRMHSPIGGKCSGFVSAYAGPLSFDLSTASQSADFGAGNVSGYTMQFTVVPEPTSALLLLGSGAMLLHRRRRASA